MQALKQLHKDGGCAQVILSDANSMYIAEVLAHHGVKVSASGLWMSPLLIEHLYVLQHQRVDHPACPQMGLSVAALPAHVKQISSTLMLRSPLSWFQPACNRH